jgi:hypothetical protein
MATILRFTCSNSVKEWNSLVILALGVIAIPRIGIAQSTWALEILGGGNYGTLSPNLYLNHYQVPFAPVGEVGINKAFSKYWSFDVRAEFIQRSVRENVSGPTGQPDKAFYLDTVSSNDLQELNYLEFPLTLRFGVPIGRVRPFAFVGIAPGFFLGGHNHMIFWDSAYSGKASTTTDTVMDAKGSVNSFILSGVGGIGVSYEVTTEISLIVEGTYETSMTNIPNGSLQQAGMNSNSPYYLPAMTPLFATNQTTQDLHVELGITIAL